MLSKVISLLRGQGLDNSEILSLKLQAGSSHLKVGRRLVKVKKKIAEGGYSDIYLTKDVTNSSILKNKQKLILKRMNVDGQQNEDSIWSTK